MLPVSTAAWPSVGTGPPPVDAQVVGCQQRTEGQQRYPQDQVEPAAGMVLGLDRIEVQHEHIQQPDRDSQAHPAQQEADKHQPGPLVLGQDQVNDEQLRIQRCEKGQPEERRVHLCSASIAAAGPDPGADQVMVVGHGCLLPPW
jgi:hypothetical protein